MDFAPAVEDLEVATAALTPYMAACPGSCCCSSDAPGRPATDGTAPTSVAGGDAVCVAASATWRIAARGGPIPVRGRLAFLVVHIITIFLRFSRKYRLSEAQ